MFFYVGFSKIYLGSCYLNRKNKILNNSVILISREEHSRQRAGESNRPLGARTDTCEDNKKPTWLEGWAGVRADLDKVRGTVGTGSCRTQRSQQGQGIQPSAGYKGSTTLRPRVDKRAQKGRENPSSIHPTPSHHWVNWSPKRTMSFLRLLCHSPRVKAPSRVSSAWAVSPKYKEIRIRSSGYMTAYACSMASKIRVLVSWPSDLGLLWFCSVMLGLSREVPGQQRRGTWAWGHQTWGLVSPPSH